MQYQETGSGPAPPITAQGIIEHANALLKQGEPLPHKKILAELLEKVEPVNFQIIAYPEIETILEELEKLEADMSLYTGNSKQNIDPRAKERFKELQGKLKKCKVTYAHYLIISVENVLYLAQQHRWGLCRNHQFTYLYNGAYWNLLDQDNLVDFLGNAAELQGVNKFKSRYYQFREHLYKQFQFAAHLPKPDRSTDTVLVNLENGTFAIGPNRSGLRGFNRGDFLTHQLPFAYDPNAQAPRFRQYLDKVLPDIQRQHVLAEYLGYVFIHPGTLKLEKTLLLYGSGANGKSVFFEIVNALLGPVNVSSYSLQSLTNENGYFRAKIANMLVNYASEINGNLETAIFKQLVSGEPVEARLPYGEPFTLTHYAKLIFNCNELPKDVEHTHAYFRRFLIIPFDVTIPEAEQDKTLSKQIIEKELSGVFNWVLEGLNRLLAQKQFSPCDAARLQAENYKLQSDSVQMFLEEQGYKPSPSQYNLIKELYNEYRHFCIDDGGYRPVNRTNFSKRLESTGIVVIRKNVGMVAYLDKIF